MQEEFLDIVDEYNKPTGEVVLRSKVHAEGLWHQVVHIYIFRKGGEGGRLEFLVHLRSLSKDVDPGRWDTRFGGHLKSGMSVEDALLAELREEVGLDASKYSFIDRGWNKYDVFPNREFQRVYLVEFDEDLSIMRFNDGEVQEVKWMSISDIESLMRQDSFQWSGGADTVLEFKLI